MLIFEASDIHYCERFADPVDRAFTFAVDQAIERKADVGILAGDIFDNSIHLHHPVVDAVIRQVKRLADHMPVLMIYGTHSHDRPGSLDIFRHVGAKHPIHVSDKPERVALVGDKWVVDGEEFSPLKLVVNALPSVNRAELRAGEESVHCGELLGELFAKWAPFNERARAANIPTILVTHGTVNGAVSEHKHAMISPDWEMTSGTLFSAQTDAVMIGHIHRAQDWREGTRRIAYAGSITRLVYGHDGKCGALMWDVQPGRSDFEHIETPSRRMVEIEFPGPPDMVALREKLADCRGAHVRLRYCVDEEHRASIDQGAIRSALELAGVADYKIEPTINPVVRTRAAGIHQAATTAEKLQRWCQLTGTAEDPLLQRLALLESGQAPGEAIPQRKAA